MIPEVYAMKQVAEATEEARAEEGWDVEPLLALVIRITPPPLGGDDAYGILPYFVQPSELHPNAAQGLLYMGGQLRREDAPPAMPPQLRRNLAAVMLCHEGWRAASPEAADEAQRAGRKFADTPGSIETRIVHIIDCGGRYICVSRARGEEPATTVIEPSDGKGWQMKGNVVVGLRDFLLGVGRHLRPDAMDRDAIAAIAREDEA